MVYGGEIVVFDTGTMQRESTLKGYLYPFHIEVGPAVKH